MKKAGEGISWQECEAAFPPFFEEVLRMTKELGIEIKDLPWDHIGLRVLNQDHVNALYQQLCNVSVGGSPISNATIRGRCISIFQLEKPIKGPAGEIPCIELPDPKQSQNYLYDGPQHIECVLRTEEPTLKSLQKTFRAKFGSHISFFDDEPKGPAEQLPNPTLILKDTQTDLEVKFHPFSIQEVVNGKISTEA